MYSTGLGLAAAYIENHLRSWEAKPAGDERTSYLQTVRVLGVKATSRSSVTVEVGGQIRTFVDGDGVTFPKNAGGRQRLTIDRVEFAGYGLDAPRANHVDFAGKDVKGAAVVWLGMRGPRTVNGSASAGLLAGRNRYATEQLHAAASIGPERRRGAGGAGRAGRGAGAGPAAAGGRGRRAIPAADFTTSAAPRPAGGAEHDRVGRLFRVPFQPRAGQIRRAETEGRGAGAAAVVPPRRREADVQPRSPTTRSSARSSRTTSSAIVEGSDPQLKNTYVAFGAHYDHVGYAEGEVTTAGGTPRRLGAPAFGFVKPGAEDDRIWNGADDDGSGTVALMALARAFAEGPRPKRSLLFVWHAGEERGRYGSLYFADYPTVPLENVVAAAQHRHDRPKPERQDVGSGDASIWSAPIASAPSSTTSAARRTQRWTSR